LEAKDLNFEVKNLESGLKSFQIEIPVEDVNKGLDACYQTLKQEASIPGFRRGRAPISILKTRFADYIRSAIFHELISPTCKEAMESAGVVPLGEIDLVPKLEEIEIKENQPIRFEMVVPVKPEIELPKYEDLQIDKSSVNVTEEEIDRTIEEMRKEHAEFFPIEEDRTVLEGDAVKIDWKYYEDGEFGAEGKDDIVEIDPENPDKGDQQNRFARELIGMKVGGEREIELDFEDDYPDLNLAGKHVKYHVTLQEITKKVLPELDDEFAKKLKYESYQQMRGAIWNRLVEIYKADLSQRQRQEIIDELIEKTALEMPEYIIQQQAETISESIKKRLRREGKSAREINAQIESIQEQIRSQALRDIKQTWIFNEIAEREEIQVTEEELDLQIRFMAQQQNRDPQKYAEMLKATKRFEDIRRSIINEKLFNFLIEKASAKQKIIV